MVLAKEKKINVAASGMTHVQAVIANVAHVRNTPWSRDQSLSS